MVYDGDDFAEMASESRIREVSREEAFKQALRFKDAWQDIIRDEWFNTGDAMADITINPQREGADSYEIGGDVIQLLIAEFGRRPGAPAPPPGQLDDWVNEQPGMPSKGDDNFDSVVYLVGQSIAENGIEPIMPGRRAWKEVEGGYEEGVRKQLEDE